MRWFSDCCTGHYWRCTVGYIAGLGNVRVWLVRRQNARERLQRHYRVAAAKRPRFAHERIDVVIGKGVAFNTGEAVLRLVSAEFDR